MEDEHHRPRETVTVYGPKPATLYLHREDSYDPVVVEVVVPPAPLPRIPTHIGLVPGTPRHN